MTPTESYIELSKLNPKYDISPNSVADASSPIGNVHDPDFYEHVVNNHAIIFDDCDIMGTIRSNGGIRASAENELDIGQESMSKMSFYLLRARRRCYRLCKWVPQYGLIEPVIGEVFSFKSALPGFMRSALKSEGIELGKDDYKEVVIHKFYKKYSRFFEDKPEFQMRDYSYDGFEPANAFISSHLLRGSAWHDLEKLGHDDVVKLVNESRKLLEFAASCVNGSILERLGKN